VGVATDEALSLLKAKAADGRQRRCERCKMRLWPKPQVRPLRFHDLRHTTASLLMEAGAPAHAVRDILRHDDIRMTVDVHGHLSPEYMRAQVDRLSFGLGWGRAPSSGRPSTKSGVSRPRPLRTGARNFLPRPSSAYARTTPVSTGSHPLWLHSRLYFDK